MHSFKRALPLAAVLCAVVWLPLSCGGAGDVRDASHSGGSYARVSVTYVHRHDDPLSRVHLQARAQFVRYRNAAAEGIEALLGQGAAELSRGECRVIDRRARTGEAFNADGPEAEVALLDAGDLLVRGPGGQSTLGSRRFPDLVPFVAGVYYGATEPPQDLEPGALGEVQVLGVGGDEVGPFAAAAPLPVESPLADVSVGPGGVDVRWTAGREPEGVRIEVRPAGGDGGRAVICAASDEGGFTVPAALVAELHTRDLELATVRLRRQGFVAAGVDAGEILASLRDVVDLTLPGAEAKAR